MLALVHSIFDLQNLIYIQSRAISSHHARERQPTTAHRRYSTFCFFRPERFRNAKGARADGEAEAPVVREVT